MIINRFELHWTSADKISPAKPKEWDIAGRFYVDQLTRFLIISIKLISDGPIGFGICPSLENSHCHFDLRATNTIETAVIPFLHVFCLSAKSFACCGLMLTTAYLSDRCVWIVMSLRLVDLVKQLSSGNLGLKKWRRIKQMFFKHSKIRFNTYYLIFPQFLHELKVINFEMK